LIGDWQEITMKTILLTSWIVKGKVTLEDFTPIADFRLHRRVEIQKQDFRK
jgi:hypothetical protein